MKDAVASIFSDIFASFGDLFTKWLEGFQTNMQTEVAGLKSEIRSLQTKFETSTKNVEDQTTEIKNFFKTSLEEENLRGLLVPAQELVVQGIQLALCDIKPKVVLNADVTLGTRDK